MEKCGEQSLCLMWVEVVSRCGGFIPLKDVVG